MTPEEIARIHSSFGAQSMMATLGATLEDVTRGSVTITAPILPGAMQQQGFGHAGLTFSIGDSAAGYAALTTLPLDSEVVTAEIKINLLAPAMGDRLIAVGKVVKPGKRLCVVTSEVFAETDGTRKMIAILQGTMVPVAG
ncbi:PaaI family thioesterase [Sulfitobacter mediterraneus]|uniref:PaaI family thioesterase n=1 Tax=Sulfitobacter mediterraneus TaxID=83219 RepID=UPI0019331074|nr:PaaI family thioesterase [Sulfitobacter mediterraneus]MBM1311746.1 PaaI family thioesterase [Sulfitobacter mediterraneus]MBM1315628.1 PaaI family thioesterase [Sulfitobacter mediterraneus]MBM1323989.1 PaaI family thioesterase [Sulfitobacter mediterraneus]MBM1327901.1 PaaI family thioesterase [Sulfitobacter mediterraneus]MBM1399249.1 PaaI family thioesterase [Sulfitobacter mediterraneus]